MALRGGKAGVDLKSLLLLPSHPLQVSSDLSSQLEALQAEKDLLRKSVHEKEHELISTKGLVQEKELLLSQATEKRAKEIQELQGKITEKVLATSGPSEEAFFSRTGGMGRCEETENRPGQRWAVALSQNSRWPCLTGSCRLKKLLFASLGCPFFRGKRKQD